MLLTFQHSYPQLLTTFGENFRLKR